MPAAVIALYPAVDFSRIAAGLSAKKVVVKSVDATGWTIVLRGLENGDVCVLASSEVPGAPLHFPSLGACVTAALDVGGEDKIYFEV